MTLPVGEEQEIEQLVPAAQSRIPSLDGLRPFSVLTVIVGHAMWYWPRVLKQSFLFHSVLSNGVAMFFVISGYLITSLLMREHRETGTLSLRRFYIRRTMRIFPPFYAYLAVIAVLWWLRLVPQYGYSFLAAATYTFSLYPITNSPYVFHSWSLSVEEVFYVCWPVLFLLFQARQSALKACLFIVMIMPIVRVGLYFIAPGLRGHEGYMIQGWIDTMMVGCSLALLKGNPMWEDWRRRWVNKWSVAGMAFMAYFMVSWVESRLPHTLRGLVHLSLSFTVNAFCLGGILIYAVENAHELVGRILNNRIVVHFGLISYGLYLWQQLFTWPDIPLLPFGFLYLWVAAEASYWLIEKPSFRIRQRFMPN